MSNLYIYCLTSKKYNLFKYLPSNIIPLGLGDNVYPKEFLNENSGINIAKHNKFLAEMTGIYWVYKNQINKCYRFLILHHFQVQCFNVFNTLLLVVEYVVVNNLKLFLYYSYVK